jgi:C-methyltransferase
VYSEALLHAAPLALATLVDRADVLELARQRLRDHAGRVDLVPGDLLEMDLGGPYQLVLLCNVLHLYGEEACRALLLRSAAALAPSGELVVKDLLVLPDRSGPESGLLFTLNMALYTTEGSVHDPDALAIWMRQAGLTSISREALTASPEGVLLRGRAEDQPRSP